MSQAPWQQNLAEIRMIDVPAKNLQESGGGSHFAQHTIDISNYVMISVNVHRPT